jgi:hypothetical protein
MQLSFQDVNLSSLLLEGVGEHRMRGKVPQLGMEICSPLCTWLTPTTHTPISGIAVSPPAGLTFGCMGAKLE